MILKICKNKQNFFLEQSLVLKRQCCDDHDHVGWCDRSDNRHQYNECQSDIFCNYTWISECEGKYRGQPYEWWNSNL